MYDTRAYRDGRPPTCPTLKDGQLGDTVRSKARTEGDVRSGGSHFDDNCIQHGVAEECLSDEKGSPKIGIDGRQELVGIYFAHQVYWPGLRSVADHDIDLATVHGLVECCIHLVFLSHVHGYRNDLEMGKVAGELILDLEYRLDSSTKDDDLGSSGSSKLSSSLRTNAGSTSSDDSGLALGGKFGTSGR